MGAVAQRQLWGLSGLGGESKVADHHSGGRVLRGSHPGAGAGSIPAICGATHPGGSAGIAVEEVKGERWEEFRDRHGDWGRDAALYLGRRRREHEVV